MHIVLFVLGVVTAVAGFLAILYGIPVNEFSFGNTLIVAGTVAVVGGFLLIGIAAVVSQLKQLAENAPLHQAPMPLPFPSADPVRPAAQPGFQAGQFMAPSPAPAPPKPDPIPRMSALSEPIHSPAPSAVAEPPEWLRPRDKTPNLADQSLIEEIEASLSPQSTLQPVSPPPPLNVYDQSFDPRLPIQARANELLPQAEQAPRPELAGRAAPPVEHAAPSGLFDTSGRKSGPHGTQRRLHVLANRMRRHQLCRRQSDLHRSRRYQLCRPHRRATKPCKEIRQGRPATSHASHIALSPKSRVSSPY